MDISAFKGRAARRDDGITIQIKDPDTDQLTDMSVTIASYKSERVKKVQRKLANAAMREHRRNPKKSSTVDEVEEKALDIMVAAVVAWQGFERDGKELPCTPENVRAILIDPDMDFVAEQIDKAADDDQAFTTASRTTS